MNKINLLYCLPEDFREVIPDLPLNATMVCAQTNPVQLPIDGAELILDCETNLWVRGAKRKYFRKVLYSHISIKLPDYREDYVTYFIPES